MSANRSHGTKKGWGHDGPADIPQGCGDSRCGGKCRRASGAPDRGSGSRLCERHQAEHAPVAELRPSCDSWEPASGAGEYQRILP